MRLMPRFKIKKGRKPAKPKAKPVVVAPLGEPRLSRKGERALQAKLAEVYATRAAELREHRRPTPVVTQTVTRVLPRELTERELGHLAATFVRDTLTDPVQRATMAWMIKEVEKQPEPPLTLF